MSEAAADPRARVRGVLADLNRRERDAWRMVSLFTKNRDAHGIMDAGAELQSIRLAKQTIEGLLEAEEGHNA